MRALFPGLDIADLLVVPTCQHAQVDLVTTGERVEDEKDRLLERFMGWAKAVCRHLQAAGHWCDYIDPCSGLPMVHTHYQQPYSEVDGLTTLLKYPVSNAGCCKVVLHPKWGSSVYPATLFAKAPLVALEEAIACACKEVSGK